MPLPLLLEQANVERIRVYERSGQLALATDAFDGHAAQIRSAVTVHQALVLNEQSSGLVHERRLVLALGIQPGRFDALMNQLRGIGHLESVSVQQRNRTGEFQRLHAQRQSLKKRHAAVLKLSETENLSIDDTLRLEQRLQDIDKELQTVGVQIGDLLSKESLYHVSVALAEYYHGSRLDPTYIWPQLRYGFIWGARSLVRAGAGNRRSVRDLVQRQNLMAGESVCGQLVAVKLYTFARIRFFRSSSFTSFARA